MQEREAVPLNDAPAATFPELEEMEQRLEFQSLQGMLTDCPVCIYYVCTEVCPPGG